MLIILTFFVALLCGALGGLLYHMQQPPAEREANGVQPLKGWSATQGKGKSSAGGGQLTRVQLGVVGDCLYGAVSGILLLALLNRLVGDLVTPIFTADSVTTSGVESAFSAWLYLTATAMVGGYLGLRLLRLVSGSAVAQWKRQLDLQKQNIAILEEELRASRASALLSEGVEKLKRGYFAPALQSFESALAFAPQSARALCLLGYCKSFLAEERHRTPGLEHISYEQALKDLNEAVRVIEEELDTSADASVKAPLYYNRACIQYLKWRSQGRSPSKLSDIEIGKLKSDIQKALQDDPNRLVWRALLADCGMTKAEFGADESAATRDLRELHEQSQAFRNFMVELIDARTPTSAVQPLHKAAVGLELDTL